MWRFRFIQNLSPVLNSESRKKAAVILVAGACQKMWTIHLIPYGIF